MTRVLLDTSVVISLGQGRLAAVGPSDEQAAISAVTLCGLHHGVLAATEESRPGRLALLTWAERHFAPLPVDARVAPAYGRLARIAAGAGRDVRRGTADLLIAATAEAHGLELVTEDESLARLPGLRARLAG